MILTHSPTLHAGQSRGLDQTLAKTEAPQPPPGPWRPGPAVVIGGAVLLAAVLVVTGWALWPWWVILTRFRGSGTDLLHPVVAGGEEHWWGPAAPTLD